MERNFGTIVIVVGLFLAGAFLISDLMKKTPAQLEDTCLVTKDDGKQVGMAIDAALEAARNH